MRNLTVIGIAGFASEKVKIEEGKGMPPIIKWFAASPNNYNVGRNGHKPIAIVHHVAEGSLASVKNWFQNPASAASTHYIVGKRGEVWQFVEDTNFAYANGIWEKPDLSIPWLADAFNRDINPNNLTLSIEREGYYKEPVTEEQYQSLLWLTRHLCDKWQIPKTRQFIIGHSQISRTSRANCPGPNHPWARLMAELGTTPPPTPEPPKPLPDRRNPYDDPDAWECTVTGKWVTNDPARFLDAWREGGLSRYGYPVSGAYVDKASGKVVQFFQRARMEYDPASRQITYGLVGAELYDLLGKPGG
jgi:N-acetyl-anhydromuramyl-L-alanine amidase AmpD